MSIQLFNGRHKLLRITLSESESLYDRPLYKTILERAREFHMSGCTVVRGIYGFGESRVIHSDINPEITWELPIIIEIVDHEGRIKEFLHMANSILKTALVTEETVDVRHYQAKNDEEKPSTSEQEVNVNQEVTSEPRLLTGRHTLLRIFIGESDKMGLMPLYVKILERARKKGLAGCTIVRGIAGFGASSIIHTDKLFRLSSDLPIIIEVVDNSQSVHQFLDEIRSWLQGALVTEEQIQVHHYTHKPEK